MLRTRATLAETMPAAAGCPPVLRGPLGQLLLRPGFDWVAVRTVAHVYFPLSRAWAAALEAKGRRAAFLEATGLERAGLLLDRALAAVETRRRAYEKARRDWEAGFFHSDGRQAEDPGPKALAGLEAARSQAAHSLMATRGHFLPWRRRLPAVRWELPTPAQVRVRHGERLEHPERAFPDPGLPEVACSRVGVGQHGGPEYWLRFRSPVLGDDAWAHVYEPKEHRNAPWFVYLHGVAMEDEMWRGLAGPVPALLERGFRVLVPEGPWHGRRRLEGWYAGEPVIGRGPLGILELLQAWVAETGALVRWARARQEDEGGGAVLIGGVSLGALTSQLTASAARGWPAEARPDGLLLVATSGELIDLAGEASLTRELGLGPRLRALGWDREKLKCWLPLMEPCRESPLPPERVLMVLGSSDDLTPFAGGQNLAEAWKIPPENLVIRPQGHFSVSLGVLNSLGPFDRLKAIAEAV